MKKILIILLVFIKILLANDTLPVKEYISMISNDLDMTIVISDEIEEDFTLMLPIDSNLTNGDHLKILIQVLKHNKLTITPFEKFFMITKDDDEDKQKKELQFVVLKNVDYETIKPIFQTVKGVNHSYISSNKTIAFNSTKKQFVKIAKLIQQLDRLPKQLKLIVTILDTNLDKLKDYGLELKQLNTFTPDTNYFFNLLAYPFTVETTVSETKTNQLHSFIRFMDTNKLTKVKSSPMITLFDNKETRFDVVNNISYINGTTTTKDGNTSSITNYSYRDVGFKLKVLPRIYTHNTYLDIELTVENLLDKSERPTTSKNYLKQTITMKKNKIYALTGINQSRNYNTLNGMPFLKDIPFLGWLFKTDNTNNVDSNLTIFLELVEDKRISVENDEIKIELPKPNLNKALSDENEHQKRVNEILGL